VLGDRGRSLAPAALVAVVVAAAQLASHPMERVTGLMFASDPAQQVIHLSGRTLIHVSVVPAGSSRKRRR
jgi:hypothetical protein